MHEGESLKGAAAGDVTIVFGTRPEMIKLAPIISALGGRAHIVHTGQHFDDSMSRTFLELFDIPDPHVRLDVGGESRGAQIGHATVAIEEYLLRHKPRVLVVQGDTNSALAGALAANAASVRLVHLEAGLRSFDRAMPEEHNRVLIDALADVCLAPHNANATLLEREGVDSSRIRVTGSTLRQALNSILPTPAERAALLEDLGLQPSRFVLATVHRAENADSESNLRTILDQLRSLPIPVVLPLHPRTKRRADEFGLNHLLAGINVVEPLGYREFISLASECAFMISDSGGVQEEATIVKRPVIIVRNSTERPEILGTFAHLVHIGAGIGERAVALWSCIDETHAMLAALPYPYGENATAECVAAIVELGQRC